MEDRRSVGMRRVSQDIVHLHLPPLPRTVILPLQLKFTLVFTHKNLCDHTNPTVAFLHSPGSSLVHRSPPAQQ